MRELDSMKLECFDCGCKNIIKAINKGLYSKVFSLKNKSYLGETNIMYYIFSECGTIIKIKVKDIKKITR